MSQETYYTRVSKREVKLFQQKLFRIYGACVIGLLLFTTILAVLEVNVGISRVAIGYAYLLLTLLLYAVIGILNFTRRLDEYYVAGRRVPALTWLGRGRERSGALYPRFSGITRFARATRRANERARL